MVKRSSLGLTWASSSSLLLRWRLCARNFWPRCVTSWDWRTVTCLDSALFKVRPFISQITLFPTSVERFILFCFAVCRKQFIRLLTCFPVSWTERPLFSVTVLQISISDLVLGDYSTLWTTASFLFRIFEMHGQVMQIVERVQSHVQRYRASYK